MPKIWTTEQADQKFSVLIRTRDHQCKRCLSNPSSDCSHFIERHNSSVRYSPENCDGLCRTCHDWFHSHREEYKEFKRQQLGDTAYQALIKLGALCVRREEAIKKFMVNHLW